MRGRAGLLCALSNPSVLLQLVVPHACLPLIGRLGCEKGEGRREGWFLAPSVDGCGDGRGKPRMVASTLRACACPLHLWPTLSTRACVCFDDSPSAPSPDLLSTAVASVDGSDLAGGLHRGGEGSISLLLLPNRAGLRV